SVSPPLSPLSPPPPAQPARTIAEVVATPATRPMRRSAREFTCHSFVVWSVMQMRGPLPHPGVMGALSPDDQTLWERSRGCQGSAPTGGSRFHHAGLRRVIAACPRRRRPATRPSPPLQSSQSAGVRLSDPLLATTEAGRPNRIPDPPNPNRPTEAPQSAAGGPRRLEK